MDSTPTNANATPEASDKPRQQNKGLRGGKTQGPKREAKPKKAGVNPEEAKESKAIDLSSITF